MIKRHTGDRTNIKYYMLCKSVLLLLLLTFITSCKQKVRQQETITQQREIIAKQREVIAKQQESTSAETDSTQVNSALRKYPSNFIFLGEKVGREENFDADVEVTNDNIESLYREYDVSVLYEEENTKYYLIKSVRFYEEARYLSRLIKIVDNKQTEAINFYDFFVVYFEKMDDNFLVGLNSLQYYHSPKEYPVCHCCEILILNQEFDKVFERRFKYKERRTTIINALNQTKEGFHAEIINAWFEDGEDDVIMYNAYFDKKGTQLRSSKVIKKMETLKDGQIMIPTSIKGLKARM